MATPVPTPSPASPSERSVASWLDVGRSLALILAVVAGLIFLVSLAFVVIRLALFGDLGGIVGAVYWLLTAIVNFLLWKEYPRFESLAAQRQFAELKDRLLLWIILGILFFLVEGIVLLLVFLKLDDLLAGRDGSAPVAATGAPPAAPLPPPVPPPPPPAGVVCPTCGQPAALIAEYNRYYCYRCSAYV